MQYQKMFYGTSYYGRANVMSGNYISELFDAQELFSSKISVELDATYPTAFYSVSEPLIFTPSAGWETNGDARTSSTSSATMTALFSGTAFVLNCLTQNVTDVAGAELKIYKEVESAGTFSWSLLDTRQINTYSLQNLAPFPVTVNGYGLANYKVEISILNDNTAPFTIRGATVEATGIEAFVSTSVDGTTWSDYELVTMTKDVDSLYKGTTTTTYSNIRYVKAKFVLFSADSEVAPVLNRASLRSLASVQFEKDGQYLLGLNMPSIAASSGKTFKETKRIIWNENLPQQTSLWIYSASSPDGVSFSGYSAPYRKNVSRLRLKNGINTHTCVLGPFNEENQQPFWKNRELLTCSSQSFLPLNSKNTGMNFTFSKTKLNRKEPQNFLQEIINPENAIEHNLSFTPQPYFLTVEMNRQSTGLSPVVDFIDIKQEMVYQQEALFDSQGISSVDNNYTGIVNLKPISTVTYNLPDASGQIPLNQTSMNASSVVYELRDKTNRPNDVMLYFQSEESLQSKTNRTTSNVDVIKGKVLRQIDKINDRTGIVESYQYNGGFVQYLRPIDIEMESTFNPALSKEKFYRYALKNGWPEEVHLTRPMQTIDEIAAMYHVTPSVITTRNPDLLIEEDETLASGQKVYIPSPTHNSNVEIQFESEQSTTEKSTHNADLLIARGSVVTDRSSEKITISAISLPNREYVEWVSDEHIYRGVINANNLRNPYGRTQLGSASNHPTERLYVVKTGDTWESLALKYNVQVADLHFYNQQSELVVGEEIVIPPNFLVPEIASGVVINNPDLYEIEILEGSVRTKNGSLSTSVIPIDWESTRKPLTVRFKESPPITASIVRGSDPHGMDPLPVWNVNRIISIARPTSGNYAEWNEGIQAGDYKLVGSYVDWSPNVGGSQEPTAGATYTVTYTVNLVEQVDIYLDSTYKEKVRADQVWRSSDIKVIDGVCTPEQDAKILLPDMETFEGYHTKYKNIEYVVEDNDVWVHTKWVKEEEDYYLLATMNGEDPQKFWHPTIEPGFYHIGNEDYYLYGESLITELTEKQVPKIENVVYPNNQTILLLPQKTNYIKDSVFQKQVYKTSYLLDVTTITL